MAGPFYIALEGSEGCGKSTHAQRLGEAIGAVITRETGGTPIGERLRAILHDTTVLDLDDRAETLIVAADRAQHMAEVVRPALAAGRHVLIEKPLALELEDCDDLLRERGFKGPLPFRRGGELRFDRAGASVPGGVVAAGKGGAGEEGEEGKAHWTAALEIPCRGGFGCFPSPGRSGCTARLQGLARIYSPLMSRAPELHSGLVSCPWGRPRRAVERRTRKGKTGRPRRG